jgi:hypothetical protein
MTTRFNRMDNIINIRGFGYWAKDRAYAPADYSPPEAVTDDHNAFSPSDTLPRDE